MLGDLAAITCALCFAFCSIAFTAAGRTVGAAVVNRMRLLAAVVVLAALVKNAKAAQGDPEAIVDAVLRSSRHLISTTLTTIGSFLPLLIFIGGQFWPPLAIVLAGGVGGSTLLAFTFTPAMFRLLICRRANRHQALDHKVAPQPA